MKPVAAAHAQRHTGFSSATTPRRAAGALVLCLGCCGPRAARAGLADLRKRRAGRVQHRCVAPGDGRSCHRAA